MSPYYSDLEAGCMKDWLAEHIKIARNYSSGSEGRRYHLRRALSCYHAVQGRQIESNLLNQAAEFQLP